MASPLTAVDRRFPLQRINLAGLEWDGRPPAGDPSAPILCLHGWLDNAASFSLLAPRLANGRQVVSVDLPGHGHSDHRPEGYLYHLLDYVHDLADLLERQPQPVHLVGHSLGGILAGLLASAEPDKLLSVTMIDSLGPPVIKVEDFPGRLQKSIHKVLSRDRKPMPVYDTPERAMKARRAGVLPLGDFACQQLVPRNLKAVEGGWTWRSDPRLRYPTPAPLTEEQVQAFLSAIKVPVLLLQAEDGLLKGDRVRERAGAVRDLTHKRVAGSHHCHLDGDVAAMAGLVDEFLARVDHPQTHLEHTVPAS